MRHSHKRRHQLAFTWPVPPLNVVLVEPEIPPNTGNIARLCAATGSRLHLVGPLGFRLTDAQLRRAGLDYWDAVDISRHDTLETAEQAVPGSRVFCFSTRGRVAYTSVRYQPGDLLVFGNESRGLPDDVLARHEPNVLGIPVRTERVRSLNLATAVAIVLYEALRQLNAEANHGQ
jgi:tRNA (cytidine/uridine-2'-O-)-methyltransferase